MPPDSPHDVLTLLDYSQHKGKWVLKRSRPESRVIPRKSHIKLALIALCLILVGCNGASHDASPTSAARYQLVVDNGGNSWRLDTNTGEIKRCWQGTPPGKAPTCYIATQE